MQRIKNKIIEKQNELQHHRYIQSIVSVIDISLVGKFIISPKAKKQNKKLILFVSQQFKLKKNLQFNG